LKPNEARELLIKDNKYPTSLRKGKDLRHGARKANEFILCDTVENIIGTYSSMLQAALYAVTPRLFHCGSTMLWRRRR
jgi:hypothetical protein